MATKWHADAEYGDIAAQSTLGVAPGETRAVGERTVGAEDIATASWHDYGDIRDVVVACSEVGCKKDKKVPEMCGRTGTVFALPDSMARRLRSETDGSRESSYLEEDHHPSSLDPHRRSLCPWVVMVQHPC